LLEKFENIKSIIRSRKSKEGRQHNCQNKNDTRQANGLQNTKHKTKVGATQTPLKQAVNSCTQG